MIRYINRTGVWVISEKEEDALEWFDRGRPPDVKIGDDLSEYYDEADEFILKADVVLRKEPKESAEKIVIKAGTKIYFYYGTEMDVYTNMDEVSWTGMVGGAGKKFLGWQLMEDAKNLPIDPPY